MAALTCDGELYGWGRSCHGELGMISEGGIPIPTKVVLPGMQKVTAVFPGIHQVLPSQGHSLHEHMSVMSDLPLQTLCLLPSKSSTAANPLQQPFCVHVCESTFGHLDRLIKLLCSRGGSPQLPLADTCHEDECMLLAALSLLKLQVSGRGTTCAGAWYHVCGGVVPHVSGRGTMCAGAWYHVCCLRVYRCHVLCPHTQLHTAIREGVPPGELGLSSGSALLNSLRECLMSLACSGDGGSSVVQRAAQGVLSSCWKVLMPKVAERAGALSNLLRAAKGGWGLLMMWAEPMSHVGCVLIQVVT